MAGKNEYIIRIKLPSEVGNNGPVSTSSANLGADNSGEEKSYWAQNAESAKAAAQKIVSVGAAAALADNLISYDLSTVSLRTGATEYEQKLKFGYSMAKQIAVPLAIGAATGGLAGAAIGLVASFAMQGITWAQNAQTIRYNQQLENISISMTNTRAGVTGSRSDKQ